MHEGDSKEPEGRGGQQLHSQRQQEGQGSLAASRPEGTRSEQELAVPTRTLLVTEPHREAELQQAGDTLGSPLHIY